MSAERAMTVDDGVLRLVPTTEADLEAIAAMERDDDTARFITAETVEGHRAALARRDAVYRSIERLDGTLVGFAIFALDPDGESLELRRIVITERGAGLGQRAMALLERVCVEQIGRRRIWLDVFEFNPRARRVYERAGYREFGEVAYDGGRRALLLDKVLDAPGA